MNKIEKEFDSKQLLPKDIVIDYAANNLYRIGLSHFSNGLSKRYKYHNTLLIFIVNLQHIIRCIIASLSKDENKNWALYIEDYSYFLNARIHVNILMIFIFMISLVSQILNYYNYKNNIKPSYLKPFEMISGLVHHKVLVSQIKLKFIK